MTQVRRGEQWIEDNFEAIIQDFWNDPSKKWTTDFKARVSIDLDEVESEVLIYHEVIAEKFEAVLQPVRIYLVERGLVSISDKFLDLWEDIPLEIKVEFWLLRRDDLGKILKTHLVAIFKLPIVHIFLLNRIIC